MAGVFIRVCLVVIIFGAIGLIGIGASSRLFIVVLGRYAGIFRVVVYYCVGFYALSVQIGVRLGVGIVVIARVFNIGVLIGVGCIAEVLGAGVLVRVDHWCVRFVLFFIVLVVFCTWIFVFAGLCVGRVGAFAGFVIGVVCTGVVVLVF